MIKIDNANNINFKSGLNSNLVRQSRNCIVSDVENHFRKQKIETNLEQCKTIAFCVSKVQQIFRALTEKNFIKNLRICAPGIYTYLPDKLNFNFEGYGFCLPETSKVFNDGKLYLTGSVFLEKENSIEMLDSKTEKSYLNGNRSSSHYLSPILHEFLHGVYIDYIYKKYGYCGFCEHTKEMYPAKDSNFDGLKVMDQIKTKKLSEKENDIVRSVLNTYATSKTNQYHEVFAETFSKLICDTLSEKDSMPTKNPLDNLQKYPKDFLSILNKVLSV
ncbi:hypothetical protein IKQ21_03910 [bacterium]|nr:hypothetical protein [bacterium]